jgi:rod shape-determining protein MreC
MSSSRYAVFDGSPPPLFLQGRSALSKLIFYSALALFLMVADARFHIVQPLRFAAAAVLYPIQWLVMQPVIGARQIGTYFENLGSVQEQALALKAQMLTLNKTTSEHATIQLENRRLRALLELAQKSPSTSIAAQVLYDAADPYSHKVMIDKGAVHGIDLGSPVLDEWGVVGQITRILPASSEVTLLTHKDHAIPVLNTRTGARSLAYGDPVSYGGSLELRFMAATSDVQQGDLLTTSGVDGVYPEGLAVAKIEHIERRADSSFAKIFCMPIAKVNGASHLLIFKPVSPLLPNMLLDKPAIEITNKKRGVK